MDFSRSAELLRKERGTSNPGSWENSPICGDDGETIRFGETGEIGETGDVGVLKDVGEAGDVGVLGSGRSSGAGPSSDPLSEGSLGSGGDGPERRGSVGSVGRGRGLVATSSSIE